MTELLEHEAAAPGRRERKKRATRLALKAAALDLVAERGFSNVTVEDIADAVDVSVRTFFNYFASKEAAIVGEDPELIEAMKADLVALPGEHSPLEAMRAILVRRIRAIAEDIDDSSATHDAWQRRRDVVRCQPEVQSAYAKHLTVIEHALTEALVERLGGEEGRRLYASLVTASALGAMRVAGMLVSEGGVEAYVELVESAFDLLEAGLLLPWPSEASTATSHDDGPTRPSDRRRKLS
jgi:AcrR family transcriptional regulator